MHYVGVDIIEIGRIQKAVEQWGERFLQRVYTGPEMSLCHKKPSALAVRFAGKEAVMKTLGTGTKGISWKEIEVLAEPSGKPLVQLYGEAKTKALDLGLESLAISLSHSREYAVAFVVSETK
ncbi:holo-ACP synthase [Chloroflexota bacterium]